MNLAGTMAGFAHQLLRSSAGMLEEKTAHGSLSQSVHDFFVTALTGLDPSITGRELNGRLRGSLGGPSSAEKYGSDHGGDNNS